MTFEITRRGKYTLSLQTPVMPAAGIFGFGDVYDKLINLDKLGALVTNPVTYEPWSPALGTRVVPLDAGVLVHTGLPSPGLSKVVRRYRDLWIRQSIPVILHLVGTGEEHVRKSANRLDGEEAVAAVELGIGDDASREAVEKMVRAATKNMQKPLIVRLPFHTAFELAQPAVDCGADALVVSAAPRGTTRDPHTGRLVSGRVYGPLVKPMALRMVAQLRKEIDPAVPIIGAGGIHSPQDARDFLDVGAAAVQVDTVSWIQPKMIERIARDLGGTLVTRPTGAFPDEWHPDMGDTEFEKLFGESEKSAKEDSQQGA